MIYLASPYSSHESETVERWRFEKVQEVTASLLAKGLTVFSPIAYSHQFVTHFQGFGKCFESWRFFDEEMIAACDEVWCLKLPDWEKSRGVIAELQLARQLGKPVAYIIDRDLIPEYEVM